jgi:hypothetical protein
LNPLRRGTGRRAANWRPWPWRRLYCRAWGNFSNPMGSTSMATSQHKADTAYAKRPWTSPRVVNRGAVTDIIRGGGGKASLPVDADGRKPSGAG